MSALGQKQTCALHKGMSALPPNSDCESGLPQKVMSALPRTSVGDIRNSVGNGVGKVGQFSRSRSLHEIVPQALGYLQLDSGSPPPFVADIALAGGSVTAAGNDLAVEPRGMEICIDQVLQLMIEPAHVDGLTATGKSMHGDDEIAHRDQSEAFGLVELRGSYVKVGVGPRPQSLEII